MKKKISNPFDVRALECKCGAVKFGNREFAEKAGWDFDESICPQCLKKLEESKKSNLPNGQ